MIEEQEMVKFKTGCKGCRGRKRDDGQEEEMEHKKKEREMDVSNIMMLGGKEREREKRGQMMREEIKHNVLHDTLEYKDRADRWSNSICK